MMRLKTPSVLLSAVLLLGPALPVAVQGQSAEGPHAEVLRREYPALYDLLVRTERAHGVLLWELYGEGDRMRSSGRARPAASAAFTADLAERLITLVRSPGQADDEADEAAAGYAILGERVARVIARTNSMHREVLGILADPALREQAQIRAALAEVVAAYQAEPTLSMPDRPKAMDMLYDHPNAMAFHDRYRDLDGIVWAGYWLAAAVTEPLTDLAPGPRRDAGVDTVMTRYFAKLSDGEGLRTFPTELPQTPPIAPYIVYLAPKATVIWDNLKYMQEVIADVLASPEVTDVRATLASTVESFMDPDFRVTDNLTWQVMALRHGIYFQGGFPLDEMSGPHLNTNSHIAHMRRGGRASIMGGMP